MFLLTWSVLPWHRESSHDAVECGLWGRGGHWAIHVSINRYFEHLNDFNVYKLGKQTYINKSWFEDTTQRMLKIMVSNIWYFKMVQVFPSTCFLNIIRKSYYNICQTSNYNKSERLLLAGINVYLCDREIILEIVYLK